ncbi:hypothetical protein DPMN_016377 [Dreissena polymorpha]|uniref:Paraneoplastic antigen Ma-like C-terminal domain-containing protein n=1 Tax=Dreissena polymorpha TaxID=45954 RepID=A0A9D4S754_DREPO|nr:hypothetical protein DPMN_016377 [Dreissena polymorpha]
MYNQPATLVPINQPVQNQPANQVPINQPSMYNQPATLVPINHPVQNQPANQVPINQPSMYNQPATLVPINHPVQNQPANPVPINQPSIPNQQATLACINQPVIPSLPVALPPATTPNPATPSYRDVITRIPKTLHFDGRINWPVFRGKFERYAKLHKWSDDERADGLVWCLVGKAADFYAVLTEGSETVSYKELLHRLEERFDAKELPANAQGRFQAISQAVGESLDEWSDRVLTLATKAFRDLPQVYATKQAVAEFWHGLQDRETGRQFSMQQPKSIEKIKMFNHIQLACAPSQRDGHKGKSDEPKRVHIVNPDQTTQPVSGLAVDKLTQVMAQLQGAVEKLNISCGSSGIDSHVKPPVPFNRPGTGGANGGQRQEGPYPGNARNQGYNTQRQGMFIGGKGGGRGYQGPNAFGRGAGGEGIILTSIVGIPTSRR